MRKVIALLIAVLLIGGCTKNNPPPQEQATAQQDATTIAERLFGHGDPRAAVAQELANPASPWWQALQNPADGPAYFAKAPVHRVDLTYNPEEKLLTGEHGIVFTNTAAEPVMRLYLVTEARLRGEGATADDRWALSDLQADGKTAAYKQEEVFAEITLAQPLQPGDATAITFSFKARLPVRSSEAGRLGPSTYGVDSMRADGLAEAVATLWTDLQMKAIGTGAFEVDLAAPSVRDVRLSLPAGWRVIGGGASIETKALADGRQQIRVVSAGTTFPFFATAALEQVSREVNGVRLVVNHRPALKAAATELLDTAEKMLTAHAAALGPFPLRELEFMPIAPQVLKGSAMYVSGLIYLNEASYQPALYGPPPGVTDPWLRRTMSYNIDQMRVMSLGHEIAHGWWGELVRVNRAQSPWWTEGITEASMLAAAERVHGQEMAQYLRDRNALGYQNNRMSGMADVASGLPLADRAKIGEYLAQSYHKPALFYDKVRRQMGDEAFFGALRRYIEPRRFALVTDRGPVEELLKAPGVAELHQRWLLETHGDEDIGLLTEEQIRQRKLVP